MEKIDETRPLRWPDADLQPLWPKLRIRTAHDDIDANHKNSRIGTINPGVDPAKVFAILPNEVRDTVDLYLNGNGTFHARRLKRPVGEGLEDRERGLRGGRRSLLRSSIEATMVPWPPAPAGILGADLRRTRRPLVRAFPVEACSVAINADMLGI